MSPKKVQKKSKRTGKATSKKKTNSNKSRLKAEVAGLLIAVTGIIMMLSIYFHVPPGLGRTHRRLTGAFLA